MAIPVLVVTGLGPASDSGMAVLSHPCTSRTGFCTGSSSEPVSRTRWGDTPARQDAAFVAPPAVDAAGSEVTKRETDAPESTTSPGEAEATAGTPISAPAAIADRNVTPKKRPRPLGSRAFIRPPMTTPHETSLP